MRLPQHYGHGEWQLYGLAADPGELNDLATEFPEHTQNLARARQAYANMRGSWKKLLAPRLSGFHVGAKKLN